MKARHKDTGEIIELAEEGIISCDGRRFCWYQVELIPESIDECKPSLPSNLDEATEEAYPKMSRLSEPHGVIPADNKTHYLGDANEENRVAFKAGAEWMTKQGVSMEINDGTKWKDVDLFVHRNVANKVIIQIRQK